MDTRLPVNLVGDADWVENLAQTKRDQAPANPAGRFHQVVGGRYRVQTCLKADRSWPSWHHQQTLGLIDNHNGTNRQHQAIADGIVKVYSPSAGTSEARPAKGVSRFG